MTGWTDEARAASAATRAAHQSGVEKATAPMQRRQYEAIAGAINSYGGDKASLAQHFAGALGGTNPQFNADKFRQAAMTGNMGRTKNADAGMQRRHFEAVAGMIRDYGASHPGEHAGVAEHFGNRLMNTNKNFDKTRFVKAAVGRDWK